MISFAILLAFTPPPGTAEVEGDRWHQLTQVVTDEGEDRELPPPFAADRQVVLTPVEGGVRVEARWRVEVMRPGWFSGMLLGTGVEAHVERVRWNGRPAAYTTDRQGSIVFAHAERDGVVELTAFVPGDPTRGEVALELLPAVSGRVRVAKAGELRPRVRDRALGEQLVERPGGFSTGSGALAVELVDPATLAADRARPDLVLARSGLGITVGEGELRGRAHVVWEIRHGELERVSLTATGLGDDLTVEGPNVREFTRTGDRIDVQLREPSRDRVDLQLRWSAAVSKDTESKLSLPRIEPHDAFRTASSVQLARDGEIEVVPDLGGWRAIAAAEVPEWGQGLVEGTPTASFEVAGTADGSVELFRFVPVEGPPVVVDVAGYQVASSREGRLLMRAHYEIRNERSAHLRVEPPPGMRIIGARVQGETALPAQDEGDAWLIPLARSVETVEGLLSFPVEVILMGETDDWARRERRKLALPVVDAPVAVSRLTMYLPPGYRSLLEPGDPDVVGSFTEGEGITYGLGVGGVGAGQADALFQQAVEAWLDNDFDAAQGRLDELREIGANNENIDKLQANLQVVRGEATGKKVDVTMERRIKEQAKARAIEDVEAERDAKQKAEQLKTAGDYVAAEQEYRRALDIGRRLEMLEQTESVEQQTKNIAYEDSLAELEKDARRQKEEKARHKADEDRSGRKKYGKRKVARSTSDGLELPVSTPTPTYGLETEAPSIASRARARPGTVIDVESIENLPVTSETTRDFTAVIDVAPTSGEDSPAFVPEEEDEEGEGPMPEPEPAPLASRDSAGISLAGTTGAESAEIELEGANIRPVARASRGVALRRVVSRGRDRRANRQSAGRGGGGLGPVGGKANVAKAKPKSPVPAGAMPPPPPAAAPPADLAVGGEGAAGGGDEATITEYAFVDDEIAGGLVRPDDDSGIAQPLEVAGEMKALERLPDPTAHATAMSVTIPTAGEAVLYQRLLLAAGATLTVDVEAREPLLERNRR